MKILLDTHFVIKLLDEVRYDLSEPDPLEIALREFEVFASVVNLWEADIKYRVGKLPLRNGVAAWPAMLARAEIDLLPVTEQHVLADIGPEPPHKDPFDRLLLCIAAAEDCQLLTNDRMLQNHPLVWKSTFP